MTKNPTTNATDEFRSLVQDQIRLIDLDALHGRGTPATRKALARINRQIERAIMADPSLEAIVTEVWEAPTYVAA